MQTPQLTIYVGCSLTLAPEQFKLDVESFKVALRQAGYHVYDFVGLINGTAADVYQKDVGTYVKNCDIFVAICDEPSIGLGWELGQAVGSGKPCLALAHQDAKVTRLVLGAAEVEPNLRLERYIRLSDMVAVVDELAATIPNQAGRTKN